MASTDLKQPFVVSSSPPTSGNETHSMDSGWGNEILSSLSQITGEQQPQYKPQVRDFGSISTEGEAKAIPDNLTPTSELEKQILQACSNGDLDALRTLLAHPEANPTNTPSSYQMLLIAIQQDRDLIVSHLLGIYKRTPITSTILSAALTHKSKPTFALLVDHDKRILEKPANDTQDSLLAIALADSDPAFAALVLRKGLDLETAIQRAREAQRSDIADLLRSSAQDEGLDTRPEFGARSDGERLQPTKLVEEEEPLPLYDENAIV